MKSDIAAWKTAAAGLTGMAAVMGIGRFVFTPILPAMMVGLDMNASEAGWIASANYVGYLLGAILAGGGWGQGREYRVATSSLVLSAVLLLIMGLTENYPLMLAVRFLAGMASAFTMVFLSTIVFARLALLGRSDLQGTFFAGVGVGMMLSAAITGLLYLGGAEWWWGWIGSAVVAGGASVLALIFLEPPARLSGPATREPPLPAGRPLQALIVAYGLFGAGYIVTATFLIAIVRAGNGGPLTESAVWLVTGLAVIPSMPLWSFLARRIGLTATFAVGLVVEAIGVTASVATGGFLGPFIGGALLGGTFVAVTSLGVQAGRLLAKQSPRRAMAVMTSAFGLGQMIAPVLAGYVADWTGSFTVPSLGAAFVLLLAAAIAATLGTAEKAAGAARGN
ncbi:YbfB/YjiJ family MFS transporter [Tianweitania sediminis]|nr:YbfB/YjiJ family MFS transporter [Tianweitania sediminis]